MTTDVLLETRVAAPRYQGKVRDTYDLGDRILIVATDRISAFDVVMGRGVPDKGAVLTQLSRFWFEKIDTVVPTHFLRLADGTPEDDLPFALPPDLIGRTTIAKKAERLDVECIVRGYLAGTAWAEYRRSGTVCGQRLPEGLVESQHTWAESVHLDAFSADGRTGFLVRLARYPAQNLAWIWLNVFTPDGGYAFHDDALPLTGFAGITDTEADDVTYALPGDAAVRLRRLGTQAAMQHGELSVRIPAHAALTPPAGPGAVPLTIEAAFTAAHTPWQNRGGRMEVFGEVTATLTLAGREIPLHAGGKWHEQRGERPRFGPAFTNANLHGEGIALLANVTADGARGFLVRDNSVARIRSFQIDSPAPERAFRVETTDGDSLEGRATVIYDFTVPVEGRRRPGTVVLARTPHGDLTGLINDWQG